MLRVNLEEALWLRRHAPREHRDAIKHWTFCLLYSGVEGGFALVPTALALKIWDLGDPCDDWSASLA